MLAATERSNAVTTTTHCILDNIILYKTQAKRLRTFLRVLGIDIKHSHALEAVARIHGLKDYHVLAAMAKTGKTQMECLDACERAMRRSERLRNFLSAGGRKITPGQAQEFIALIYPEKSEGGPATAVVTVSPSLPDLLEQRTLACGNL